MMFGHAQDSIPGVTKLVEAGGRLMVGETEIRVIHVPCHTTGHVVFAVLGKDDGGGGGGGDGGGGGGGAEAGSNGAHHGSSSGSGSGVDDGGGGGALIPLQRVEAVFTGDAIINGGVGAFFHGGPRDCYDNLHVRLAGLPDAALIFSGGAAAAAAATLQR